jgi:hypothetical protein
MRKSGTFRAALPTEPWRRSPKPRTTGAWTDPTRSRPPSAHVPIRRSRRGARQAKRTSGCRD